LINLESRKVAAKFDSELGLYALYLIYHNQAPFAKSDLTEGNWWERLIASAPSSSQIWNKQQIRTINQMRVLLHQLFDKRTVRLKSLAIGLETTLREDDFQFKALPSVSEGESDPIYIHEDSGTSLYEWISRFLCNFKFEAIFSDGVRISLFHPNHFYYLLLPKELLLGSIDINATFAKFDSDVRTDFLYYLFEKTIQWFSEFKNVEKYVFSTFKPKMGFPIASFKMLSADQASWEVRCDENSRVHFIGKNQLEQSDQHRVFATNINYDPLKKQLYWHHLSRHYDQLVSICDGNIETIKPHHFVTTDANAANLCIKHLEWKVKGNCQIINLEHNDAITRKLEVHFDSSRPDLFGFKMTIGQCVVTKPIVTLFQCILFGFNEGLAAAMDEYASDLVVAKKGVRRSHEIRLFDHRGFSLFVLSHIFNQILQRNASTEALKELYENYPALACSILKVENPKGIVSKGFDNLLKKIYETLKAPNYFYSFNQGKILKTILNEGYMKLGMALLSFLISRDPRGIFFKRSSSKYNIHLYDIGGNHLIKDEDNDVENGEIEAKDILGDLLKFSCPKAYPELIEHLPLDYEVFIDGEPIEHLTEKDFNALLALHQRDSREDWFELDPKFYFKGAEISLEDALKFTTSKIIPYQGKLYQIDQNAIANLRWLNRLWDQLQTFNSTNQSKKSDRIYHVPRSSSLELLAWRAAGLTIEGGEAWQKICGEFDRLASNIHEVSQHQFPEISAPLKEHQKVGVRWMLDLHSLSLGGVLADDMGLGKTLQTLAFLELLKERGKLGHSLVVVPTSLVYNWLSEVQKFTPSCPIMVFDAKVKETYSEYINTHQHTVLICSYGMLISNHEFFEEQSWNVAIFDEAQSIKNITSKRTTIARKLKATSKFCLTGTPMENHFGEYYSLIDLVVPGALGTYAKFMEVYNPKSKNGVSTANIEFLKLKTTPLILRRHKSKILKDLPGKTENIVRIPFDKQQKRIYSDIAIAFNESVHQIIEQKGESRSQLEMLTALLRLRQACSCPASLPKVVYTRTPPKIAILVEQVEALLDKGESVLVFTNFVSTLDYIKSIFEHHHHQALCIHGSMSQAQRKTTLESFENSDKPMLLIMTLKTGGVGLNLTKANHVFHLEPWWNPAAENQGTDRVHRMGQTKHVNVVRFIMEHSIEEKIQNLKLKKSQSFEALFSESTEDLEKLSETQAFNKQQLTQEDFKYLLDLDDLPQAH